MLNSPRIEINLTKVRNNTEKVVGLASSKGIEIWGVTKGAGGDLEVARAMLAGGVVGLADARMVNLKRLASLNSPLMLLRIPMLDEIREIIKYIDVSLNSELEVIRSLNQEAKRLDKVHKIILMVDLGDRREGILPKNVIDTVKEIKKLNNIRLIGLGTNFACFAGVLPTAGKMSQLMNLVDKIRDNLKLDLPIISGGNSSSLPLLKEEKYTPIANQLRVGETILLGLEVPTGTKFSLTSIETFKLVAPIIELKDKNILIDGQERIQRRAILAIGKQDIIPEGLKLLDKSISIVGASSDHLIVDISLRDDLKLGDEIEFRLDYASLLRVMTSSYIKKVYCGRG